MRIILIGCVEFSYKAFMALRAIESAEIVGVVTKKSSSFNADFVSLEPLAVAAGIPCFFSGKDQDSLLPEWLRALKPDVIYCFGWSFLLPQDILNIPAYGAIGYHPAALPYNKGRHPLIWALVLGLKETASTFFFMDSGADSGDILSQQKVAIAPNDDARSLYDKINFVACEQIRQFTPALISKTYTRIPQDKSVGNSWRKRGKEDGKIDWRMSAISIYNLVRALTRPYVGAHCSYNGADIKIWAVEISQYAPENIEPGKILAVNGPQITVKCGDGSIIIKGHEFPALPEKGSYL